VDFRLSHAANTFASQLNNLLLSAYNRRFIKKRTTLNDSVAGQYGRLLTDFLGGHKVYRWQDLETFFNQQYIRNKFQIAANRIVWNGKMTARSRSCCAYADIVLDFRLSHTENTFAGQLNNLLLRANNRKFNKKRTTLNERVAGQYGRLLTALRGGHKVYHHQDLEKFFDQQYIHREFEIVADRIVWDGEMTADSSVITKHKLSRLTVM